MVRLKGGDPYVFGRGGEEALYAAEQGVPCEVVPGVTAGVAATASAGIPVTQRGLASSVTFVTGHEDPSKPESDLDWGSLAVSGATLVFYMGVGRLASIAEALTAHGLDPSTPAAVIHRGATARQRTVAGPLEALERLAAEAEIGPPALIVVGKVVALRERLNWFERRPLFGRTVLVTRTREQASEFSASLRELGARVLELPAIRLEEHPAAGERLAALPLGDYDWVVFTSVNGVRGLCRLLRKQGRDLRALGSAALCAIGPATAAALEELGLRVELVPESYVAEAVAAALAARGDLDAKKILLPRAESARAVLPETLRALGALVDEVPLYRTLAGEPENLPEVRAELERGGIEVVTFASSSTVEHFVRLIGEETIRRLIGKTLFAAIGPVTASTAREHGLEPLLVADSYTLTALAGKLCAHFSVDCARPLS